jgi:beta-N-acetylhexosaminidase
MDRLHQLALGCILGSFRGAEAPVWLLERAADGLGGVVLFADNIRESMQLQQLTASLHGERDGFVVATDEEGGDVTRLDAAVGSPYPGAAALGVVDDVDATRAVARSIGKRLRAAGVDMDLAPCADVNSEASNPVIGIRSFGSDPALVARHVAAFTSGLSEAGVVACLKHFPGHGAACVDSHLTRPVVDADRELLEQRELVPFRAGTAAGAGAVMTAHLVVPALDDQPATTSRRILVDLLRGEIGFSGVVVTDALDMGGACADCSIPEAAVRSLAAGADLLCLGAGKDAEMIDDIAAAVVAAVRSGILSEERLADAVGRTRHLRTSTANVMDHSETDVDARDVARRAISVDHGPVPAQHHAVVVTCCPPAGIAVGEVPWGVADALRSLDPTTTAHDVVGPAVDRADLDKVLVDADGRPVVIVVRDAHRYRWQSEVVELVAAHRDAVVVEMGWPGEAFTGGGGAVPVLRTWGASRASGEAVARLLVEGVR